MLKTFLNGAIVVEEVNDSNGVYEAAFHPGIYLGAGYGDSIEEACYELLSNVSEDARHIALQAASFLGWNNPPHIPDADWFIGNGLHIEIADYEESLDEHEGKSFSYLDGKIEVTRENREWVAIYLHSFDNDCGTGKTIRGAVYDLLVRTSAIILRGLLMQQIETLDEDSNEND